MPARKSYHTKRSELPLDRTSPREPDYTAPKASAAYCEGLQDGAAIMDYAQEVADFRVIDADAIAWLNVLLYKPNWGCFRQVCATQAELMGDKKVSRPTFKKYVDQLVAAHLVERTGWERSCLGGSRFTSRCYRYRVLTAAEAKRRYAAEYERIEAADRAAAIRPEPPPLMSNSLPVTEIRRIIDLTLEYFQTVSEREAPKPKPEPAPTEKRA